MRGNSMGVARDIVKKIMKNEENYLPLGLKMSNNNEWQEYNLLIGKNGSGKSRIIKMIKENATKENCVVIHMDFSESMYQEEKKEEIDLARMLIFGKEQDNDAFDKFLIHMNSQVLKIFEQLFDMCKYNELFKKEAEDILRQLDISIKEILDRSIVIDEEGIALQKANVKKNIQEEWHIMSPGEKVILTIIMAVLIIGTVKRPCILLIDEPENHLHPAAQIKMLKLLKKGLENMDHCTCIASHSIIYLPLFEIKQIAYMNNGERQKINGTLYQQIYDKLVGQSANDDASLAGFLQSVATWEYAEYLAECFQEPQNIEKATANDEQALKLRKVLLEQYEKSQVINVLDFGAGSARIGRCLELRLLEENDEKLKEVVSRMKYHIYDKYKISEEFEENKEWRGHAFSSEQELLDAKDSFDIILLFNVLHEISVEKWEEELNFIFRLLKFSGKLIFAEREILSMGEKPYGKSGYLVLGESELSKLFQGFKMRRIDLPEKVQEVTICYVIERDGLSNPLVNRDDVLNALKSLVQNSKNKIRDMLQNGTGRTLKARQYAFYCQQYVNAQMALEILNMNKKNQTSYERLVDIINSDLSRAERKDMLLKLSAIDNEEGQKCRDYLNKHYEG